MNGNGAAHLHTLQNTNTPDINLERDIDEIALGMEVDQIRKPAKKKSTKFQINISTIIISALLFLLVLSWFDFMQTTFFAALAPASETLVSPEVKFYYALLVTLVVIILCILIYYYNAERLTK